jgi:hypothetical protein
MRPLLLQVLVAVVGVSPAAAARMGLSMRLRGQAHVLQRRLSHLEEAVRRGSRHAGRIQHKVDQQWEEAEDEMLKLRQQVESTEKEARKSLEPLEAEGDVMEVSSSESATKGELRAVEAKLAGQQAQLDRLESIVDRLANNAALPSKAANTSQPTQPQEPQIPPDAETASQAAADNLAKEMGTAKEGGLLTEDEVNEEDKEYHTPAPHVAAPESMTMADEEKPSAQVDPVRLASHAEDLEDTWQDFEDVGEDPEEASGLEEEQPAVPVKDVLNMANGNLQPFAPAEVREVDIHRSHSQQSAESKSSVHDAEDEADGDDSDVDVDSVAEDAEESSSKMPDLVPLRKVEEETAQVEEQDSNDAPLPAFDMEEQEDVEPHPKEIPLATAKKSVKARDGSLDSAEQLLRDDGSADGLSPTAMGHVLGDSSTEMPGAVALAAPQVPRRLPDLVRTPMAMIPSVPHFFGPPPKDIPVSAPA